MKKLKSFIIALIIFIIGIIIILSIYNTKKEIQTVSSKNTLKKLYNGSNYEIPDFFITIFTTPWSFSFTNLFNIADSSYSNYSAINRNSELTFQMILLLPLQCL